MQQVKERVSATIAELMDGGGTTPIVTDSVLLEESPEILDGLQAHDLIALCDDIQRSEIPEVSRRFSDGTWLAEMRRLRKAGAPVGNIQLDWGDLS